MSGSGKFTRPALEALENATGILDDLVGGQFAEKQGRDIGGIEPDAYTGSLFINWREAVGAMGLPADDATFLRYEDIRYWRLFEFRMDNFGNTVISEKRVPPRLTPEENYDVVTETMRDMEHVRRGEASLTPTGALEYHNLPNDYPKSPNDRVEGLPPQKASGASNSYPEVPSQPGPEDEFIAGSDDEDVDPRSRPKRPSDVFGVPETSRTEQGRRRMRPDDHFGTPETRVNLSSIEPERVSVFRTASAPRTPASGHTYSMSIRPGETKTQRIELPGLTLELVISMVA